MAIKIFLGNVGSGKTASAVREMYKRPYQHFYTNIKTTLQNADVIDGSMIVERKQVGEKKKRSGEVEPIYKHQLNETFWKDAVKKHKKAISVVLDEAHTITNSRRSMSNVNIIVTDWIALIRRVLGSTPDMQGDLILISQLWHRIDVIAREMAHQIFYHVCHYTKSCKECNVSWHEHTEMDEQFEVCPVCGSWKLQKMHHRIVVTCFGSESDFLEWEGFGKKTYYKRYIINDIEQYFPLYNTLQWENMFSKLYV